MTSSYGLQLEEEQENKKLLGSQLIDNLYGKVGEIGQSIVKASEDDPDTWTDDMIRLGLGGAKNVGNVLNAPGIRHALQALGAPAWVVGRGLGWTLEKAGVDPRYGHIAGEVGEWFIPFYGAGNLVKKAKQFSTNVSRLADMTPMQRALASGTVGAAKPVYKKTQILKQALTDTINNVPTRSQAEPVTRQLALDLQKRLGGTKEQAVAFHKFQQKAGRDIVEVIRALNAKALQQEPKNIAEFMEAVEVALGTKVDYRDFIAKGKSITYKSGKGKQVINDLNDLNVALLNRLEVVGGGGVRRSKGHYSLGHIRAVQNLIEQGDVGANRLSNMEPEVLRSVLRLTNANPNKIEEVVEILGNSARKNISDKPSEILTAQGVSRTIDEEYLKFINPENLGSYWREVLPVEHYDWFEDAVEAAVSQKIKFARNLKKVSTVEEGKAIISKMRQTAIDDALDALRPFANALTDKRAFDLNTSILREAPEIILDHIQLIKNKIQWVPPKPDHKDWATMKAILAKNNLSIEDVDTALRAGWRIQEGTSSLKTPLPKLKSKTIAASKLTISEIEARINAGWTVDFTK